MTAEQEQELATICARVFVAHKTYGKDGTLASRIELDTETRRLCRLIQTARQTVADRRVR